MKPADKITIPDVFDRFLAYYLEVGEEWGSLHVILSDGNVSDGCVERAINEPYFSDDPEAIELCKILLRMSKRQRLRLPDVVYDVAHGKPRPWEIR